MQAFLASALGAAGGIGGGGILVPLFTSLGGFSIHHAIPLTQACVLGASVMNFIQVNSLPASCPCEHRAQSRFFGRVLDQPTSLTIAQIVAQPAYYVLPLTFAFSFTLGTIISCQLLCKYTRCQKESIEAARKAIDDCSTQINHGSRACSPAR